MWFKSKIGLKLALVILLVNIAALLVLSLLFYKQFEGALNDRILQQLTSIKRLKHRQIEEYLQEKKANFNALSINEIIFSDQFPPMPEGDTLIIRKKGDEVINYQVNKGLFIIPFTGTTGIKILDLSPANPQKEMLAAYIKTIDDHRELILITPLIKIHEIVLERTGMGETGETYIVGNDLKMRSVSRFLDERPLDIEVKTEGSIASLQGKAGTGVFKDYRGVEVFSSYQPMKFYDFEWAILSEMDESEVLKPLAAMRRNLIIIGSAIFTIMLLLSFVVSQAVVRPLVKMKDILNKMASGKIVKVEFKPSADDEIGQMFQALDKHINALHDIALFADRIGSQNFEAEYQLLSKEDALGSSLIQMRDKLREYKINEEDYRREKEKALWQGQEKERSRLSKELHDGLGPLLTTLKLTISRIEMNEKDKSKLKIQLDETINEIRHMSYNLMPQALLDFGVGKALGNLVDLLGKVTPVSITYVNAMKPGSGIPEEINIGIYRIAQEALNNALKYSNASEIKLSLTEFDDYIGLYMRDNGNGFNKDAERGGTGILNMQERARSLNGAFQIETSPHGTTIEVEIPLPVITLNLPEVL